ncbi:MAG: hypothetical protein E6Q97_12525 [Desulfurellales bacterium]|nr:MAG: hypothetical protein E6Q97_12525 [Desulfurellales bacterium]
MSAWGNIFAPPGLLGGGLTDDERRMLQMRAMMEAGGAMLQGSGWSDVPITGGQALGAGLAAGTRAAREGAAETLSAKREREAADREAKAEAVRAAAIESIKDPTLRAAAMNPSAQNVFLEAYRRENPAPAETEPEVRTRVVGGVEYYYDGARWKPVPKDKPASGGAGKPRDQFRTLSADEVVRMGLPPGSAAQVNESTGAIKVLSKPTASGTGGAAKADGSGMNARQQAGRDARNNAVLDYAANLTGTPKTDLAAMAPEEVAAIVREKGGRLVQGGVARTIGAIPFIGGGLVDSANSELAPWASQMAAGQVSVNNPAGDVGEKAFDLAARQVPSPSMDLETQAQMIQKLLEEGRQEPGVAEPTQAEIEAELRRRGLM